MGEVRQEGDGTQGQRRRGEWLQGRIGGWISGQSDPTAELVKQGGATAGREEAGSASAGGSESGSSGKGSGSNSDSGSKSDSDGEGPIDVAADAGGGALRCRPPAQRAARARRRRLTWGVRAPGAGGRSASAALSPILASADGSDRQVADGAGEEPLEPLEPPSEPPESVL